MTAIDLSVMTGDAYSRLTVTRCNDQKLSDYTDLSLYFDFYPIGTYRASRRRSGADAQG